MSTEDDAVTAAAEAGLRAAFDVATRFTVSQLGHGAMCALLYMAQSADYSSGAPVWSGRWFHLAHGLGIETTERRDKTPGAAERRHAAYHRVRRHLRRLGALGLISLDAASSTKTVRVYRLHLETQPAEAVTP